MNCTTLEPGCYYIGSWCNGVEHGQGVRYYNNFRFEGSFRNDMMHGRGVWVDSYGNRRSCIMINDYEQESVEPTHTVTPPAQ
eukprot:9840-Heterococcus_DN1.PRE.1